MRLNKQMDLYLTTSDSTSSSVVMGDFPFDSAGNEVTVLNGDKDDGDS